jgi:EmrB/QacA subfamily drug resistance transporter
MYPEGSFDGADVARDLEHGGELSGDPGTRTREGGGLLVLLCATIPSFMINLDANIVAVSLTSIAHTLKADFAGVEWVISAYTLTFASFMLLSGALADRFGRKRVLMAGLAIFTLASLVCGASATIGVLNAARAAQGFGAALQLSAALALLSHEFRGAARARAFAFWGSVIGVGATLGPIVGGMITEFFGWRWAFYINIPVGAVMIALTAFTVAESRDPDARRLDLLGASSFCLALFLTTLALISGNRDGWDRRHILAEGVGAAVMFALFIYAETVQARPMLDLSFFRKPTYVGAICSSLGFAIGLLTMLTYIPIYLQTGLGYDPLWAGLLMLPMALPLFLVPRLTAHVLIYRLSGRALLASGLLLVSVGMLWLGVAVVAHAYPALLGGLVVAGCGAGILNGETAKVAMTVIPPERAGMASGMSGTTRFTGVVLGFAALGALLYGRIHGVVTAHVPAGVDSGAFAHGVAAGHLAPASMPGLSAVAAQRLRSLSLDAGYQAIFLAAAGVAAAFALACWLLVDPKETAPIHLARAETTVGVE